jgi:hypothetical protein
MNRLIGGRLMRTFGLLIAIAIQWSEAADAALVKAPELLAGETSNPKDLGVWDDVYPAPDQDFILARRDDALVSISTAPGFKKAILAKSSVLKDTQIDSAIWSGDHIWVLLNSSKGLPFVFEAHRGKVAQFDIPGLTVPGRQAPTIDSCVPVPSNHAAIVSVSGGNGKSWPRDGNRPVYFWLSLESGKIIRLPIGWDLDYFSPDQSVGVFSEFGVMPEGRVARQGIDLKTGKITQEFPNPETELYVNYSWTDRVPVKELCFGRSLLPNVNWLQGVAIDGKTFRLDIPNAAEEGNVLDKMKAGDGFVGFCFSRSGHSGPSSFWLAPLKQHGKAENLQDDISDFSLLGEGRCVMSMGDRSSPSRVSKVIFDTYDRSASWDVLDGVEHPLCADLRIDGGYLKDEMRAHLIDGVGGRQHAPLALAIFSIARRQAGPLSGAEDVTTIWRRVIAITGEGKRYLTALFPNGAEPDGIWLNKAGTVVAMTKSWRGPNLPEIRLSGFELVLP